MGKPAETARQRLKPLSHSFTLDFVVLHPTWEGIQRCKEAIQEWLQGMGLELKEAKTRFAHTLEAKEECQYNVGFDFLGFTIRQFPVGKGQSKTHKSYKTIITPSKASIKTHYRTLAEVIERNKASTLDEVIAQLNPKIVGWSKYFSGVVSAKIFQQLDYRMRWKILRWAYRKHPTKGKWWVIKKYCTSTNGRKYKAVIGKTATLKWHGDTPIKRHEVLRTGVSPYDGNWSYWGTRRGKYLGVDTLQGRLLKHQGGRCTHCRLLFTVDDAIETHHRDGNRKNNRFATLILLHRICHDLTHGTGTRGSQP
jgi:RNA-directed DNA polymerase